MATEEQFQTITECPLFSEISGKALFAVLEALEQRQYAARETIVRKGDPSCGVHVIVTGLVTVYQAHGAKMLRLASLERPQPLGVFGALRGGPRTATAVAETDTITLWIGREALLDALDRQPESWRGVAMYLADQAVRMAETEEALLRDLRHRLARLLLRLADPLTGAVPATQQDMAEMLGTHRSALQPHIIAFRKVGAVQAGHPMVINRRKLLEFV
ncbi:Crp/Fnr family transcriptional regulator [Azospirillum sp. B506]|uniref:Crp/Fnr family transcriptional regulator n=1 Tax=Azospirillum sp. B506 TaxID=137721 RepID=UPI0005B2B773|nr:cyclic nucleotide-binding domain-containing protein [Azospirillum sp. B506]